MKAWWKAVWERLLTPKKGIILADLLIATLSIAGALTMVFLGYSGVFSYPMYALAALSLAYTVYLFVKVFPKWRAGLWEKLSRKKFTRNLTQNYTFRTLVFATGSFVVNVGFVVYNTVFAIWTGNGWYGCLAGYYLLLGALRGCVFAWDKRAKKRVEGQENRYKILQLKNYRRCGIALFALDGAMAVAVTLMVLAQKPTKYTEITAIVFAAYSVYKISLAIWNIFKAKKTKDMQIQSFRNVGLADAAISLLSLQTTLVATFSTEGESMLALNAVTGAFVCLFTVGMGVFMVVKSTKLLRENNLKNE